MSNDCRTVSVPLSSMVRLARCIWVYLIQYKTRHPTYALVLSWDPKFPVCMSKQTKCSW